MQKPALSPNPTLYLLSLGCPKNRVDSEVMLGTLLEQGYELVQEAKDAEVVLINSCAFIGEAKQESIDAILEMARHKQAGTCKRLVVTGCLSQRYPNELAAEMPEVDQFLGTDEVGSIAKAIAGTVTRLAVADTPAYLYDDASPRRRSQAAHSAYVKIAEGCDRPCAFCIIPKLRGPQRSRTPESVVREAHDLVAGGTREICLIAQDLTTYGTDLRGAKQTSAPAAGAAEPRVAKYLDVPIQHVDSGVLKSMRRGYGERQVRDLVDRFRARVPGGTLRTTFIAGHPGESDAAFQRLCDFVREAELDHVGVFNFSREEGTVAAMLPKRVPQKEIDARRRELLRIQRQVSKKKLRALHGRLLRVLVEGASDESEYLSMGRHEGQAPEIDGQVYLSLPPDAPTPTPGTFVDARVTHSAEYDLAAELVA